MAKLLLLETATSVCSVAISEGDNVLVELEAAELMSHTSQLTLLIGEALNQADIELSEIEGIALSAGPGSYTALRVGASTAKGLCFGLDIPFMAISTLEALASMMRTAQIVGPIGEEDLFFPMIDARRMEIYGAIYGKNGDEKLAPEAIILDSERIKDLIPEKGRLFLGGDGAGKASDLCDDSRVILTDIQCSAVGLLNLAREAFEEQNFTNSAYFKPFYLKSPNITTPKPLWK